MAYRANPFLGHPSSSLLDSPYLNFSIFDAATEPLNLTQGSARGDLIQYQLPYSPVRYLDSVTLRCKTFNGSTFEDPGCGLRVFTPATCFNCSGDLNLTTIAICFCNHLVPTGLSLVYDLPLVLDPLDILALPFYGDRFQVSHWAESLGFRVAIAAGLVYGVGLFLSIIVDIKPRKSLILRLMKDLRDIDRFGLHQQQAANEEDSMMEDMDSMPHSLKGGKPTPKKPKGLMDPVSESKMTLIDNN